MHYKLLAVLGFVLLYNLLFYKAGLGLSTSLLFLTFHGLLFLLRNKEGRYLTPALTFSSFSLLFAFFLTFSSNQILIPLNLFLTIFTTLIAFYFYNLGSGFNYLFSQYLMIPFKSVSQLVEGVFKTPKLISTEKLSRVNNPGTSALLKGILMAFPLVIILLFLFNLADPVYNKHTMDILSNIQKMLVGPFWERLLISAVVTLISLGVLGGLLKLKHEEEKENTNEIGHGKQIELITFLSLPILIFLSFILVQFEYLFSNISERSLSEIGIHSLTYSEYVRKGFFELLIVSIISLSIIGFVSRFVHRVKNKYEHVLKACISILIIQTQIILFSVVWRVVMYQMEHGLTRYRIIGMVFLIWLSLALFLYLIKVLINMKQKLIFWSLTVITVFAVSLLTVSNVDRMIAVNFRPSVNDRIDYHYIAKLSFDAVSGWAQAIIDIEKALPEYELKTKLDSDDSYKVGCFNLALIELKHKKDLLNEKYGKNGLKNWREFNLSEYKAFETITQQTEWSKLENLIQRTKSVREKYLKDNGYTNQSGYYPPYCGSY